VKSYYLLLSTYYQRVKSYYLLLSTYYQRVKSYYLLLSTYYQKMKILFVCSRNKWRSRTAETIFKDTNGWQVRSAGTENAARIRLTASMVAWADWIFVMEQEHKNRILADFGEAAAGKNLRVLEIADDYKYMDKELIGELRLAVSEYL
jgi:predicted protein tyrosine phosphatase